jgi:two-component system, response regulator RegA
MQNRRVLVIDDDDAFAGALARSMERRGCVARTASSTADALLAAMEFAPSHAVLDLKLGTESGLRTLRELRARFPDLRVLLLTGYASLSTAVEAIKLGAVNYLAKPVDAKAVLMAFNLRDGDAVFSDATASAPALKRLEWEHIHRVLHDSAGNISHAARVLGLHRRTLQRKLAKRARPGLR